MNAKYTITEANAVKGFIKVDVDFGDGSPAYSKGMMAPVADGADAVVAVIEGWLADLGDSKPNAPAPVVSDDLQKMIGQAQTFTAAAVEADVLVEEPLA